MILGVSLNKQKAPLTPLIIAYHRSQRPLCHQWILIFNVVIVILRKILISADSFARASTGFSHTNFDLRHSRKTPIEIISYHIVYLIRRASVTHALDQP